MALTERNGIWHWRKVVQGHTFARFLDSFPRRLNEAFESPEFENLPLSILVAGGKCPS